MDRHTDRLTDRQADKQTDIYISHEIQNKFYSQCNLKVKTVNTRSNRNLSDYQ